MATQRVDGLRTLPYIELAGAEHHPERLLVHALDGHETHRGPGDRFGNCLGIRRIILLPLTNGLT